MSAVDQKLKELIYEMKNSEAYKNFERYKQQLDMNYDLRRRVDDYRRICFQMQQSGEDLYDRSDDLLREFSDLFTNTTSREFLFAEATVCRMIREISLAISKEVDVDMNF